MPTLVPGGAIERLVNAKGLTPTSDEGYILGDQVAIATTTTGLVVFTTGQENANFIPFE